mgnify:FL=1
MFNKNPTIGIIGLGYVGLPLAVEFGKIFQTIGFEINTTRVEELKGGYDATLELSSEALGVATQLSFTTSMSAIEGCDVYIITVPTPIDKNCQPDLRYLKSASELVGEVLRSGNLVVLESTVFPGCTEEVCIPIMEKVSGLRYNTDFFAGYSPERINPGDKNRRIHNIVKITSGSTLETADFVDELYCKIVTVGTHRASSIKVAEAAKVIENTQRDVNIALMNELSLIFDRMDIDTLEVLQAAETKWNFLPFRPGLVGGHCISVDPYYLTHKAQQLGYYPEVILSGRRVNAGMGQHVADTLVKIMTHRRIHVVDAKILVMGLTFKENCPDIRNTGVIDIIQSLKTYNAAVDVYDPWVNPVEAKKEYDIDLIEQPLEREYDGIVVAVGHKQFVTLGAAGIRGFGKSEHVLYDVKHILAKNEVDARL